MMGIMTDKDRAVMLAELESTGVFVTCGKSTPNIMVAHWAITGNLWGRNVFILPIRSSKYSYQIVNQTKSFAINVPARDMRSEIAACDTISGFKYNKFEKLGLHPKRARKIEAYVLGESKLIAECNVVAVIPPESITPLVDDLITPRSHTLFVGEIVDCYRPK